MLAFPLRVEQGRESGKAIESSQEKERSGLGGGYVLGGPRGWGCRGRTGLFGMT